MLAYVTGMLDIRCIWEGYSVICSYMALNTYVIQKISFVYAENFHHVGTYE